VFAVREAQWWHDLRDGAQ